MAEVDDLKAELYDLEDELTCLTADLRNAEDYVDEIDSHIASVRDSITFTRRAIKKLERS